jgi:hypothetical protein
MKGLIDNIRKHNFNLGEDRNDYNTTTNSTFKYDSQSAQTSKGYMDVSMKNDLRSTHYKLGYQQDNNQTTHQATYVPMPLGKAGFKDPLLRQSHFHLGNINKNNFDHKSIYMVDFNKKELVE